MMNELLALPKEGHRPVNSGVPLAGKQPALSLDFLSIVCRRGDRACPSGGLTSQRCSIMAAGHKGGQLHRQQCRLFPRGQFHRDDVTRLHLAARDYNRHDPGLSDDATLRVPPE
jgi:hypothetical protein